MVSVKEIEDKNNDEFLYTEIVRMVNDKQERINRVLSDQRKLASTKLNELVNLKTDFDAYISQNTVLDNEVASAYLQNKVQAVALPMLIDLIEEGQQDGSWECEFSENTAKFILRRMTESYSDVEGKTDIDSRKMSLLKILSWVLCAPSVLNASFQR